ncbi:MAG: kelch repeat-containing protein, partial [Gemmatimonadaceae bacterium]
ARKRVVLFGGDRANGAPATDTWSFTGSTWTRLSTEGPSPRAASMVYDSKRDRIVLFGGSGPTGLHNDTWEFDGTRWKLVMRDSAAASPPARALAALAYDSRRARVVLTAGFAGFDPAARGPKMLDDTWEWDGRSWTQVNTPGPGARDHSASVYDPTRGVVILHGGGMLKGNAPELVGDTWSYDGRQWTRLRDDGPPRGRHRLAYDSRAKEVLLYGGWAPGNIQSSDLWTLGDTWKRLSPANGVPAQSASGPTPPDRRHHALTFDPVIRRVLLSGGQQLVSNTETPLLSDLWSWDGARWTQVTANAGIPIFTHKLFADSARGVFAVMSRGLVARLDGSRWSVAVNDSMTRRESAAGAYDTHRKKFVVFGGLVGGRAFDLTDETWEFDGQQWNRAGTSGPPPTLGSSMAYDSRRQVMVLFGGLDTTGRKLGDTWEWNGTRWSHVASAGPPARFGAGIAYDTKRGETILFGGVDSANTKLNDTWRWDGRSWHRAESAVVPPPRSEGYLAYDETRGVVVMVGGEGVAVVPTLGDTWEWNGTQWTKVLP